MFHDIFQLIFELRFVLKGQTFESKDNHSVSVLLLLDRKPGLQENTLCESLRKSSLNLESRWTPDLQHLQCLLGLGRWSLQGEGMTFLLQENCMI